MATKKIVKKEVPKKVVKKVVQKTTKKVLVKKSTSACSCVCKKTCKPAQAFWVNNGPVVNSVETLLKALKEMTDEQFVYHTKREGNDFVNWIKDCLNDIDCAKALKKAQTRTGAVRVLSRECEKC
jgi:hypothetical protein